MATNAMMFLLVSALTLLVGTTVAVPVDPMYNLEHVVLLSEKLNTTLMEDIFVEDVKNVVGSCNSTFFCRVHSVLNSTQRFHESSEAKSIVRNLKMFNQREHVNCTKVQSHLEKRRVGTTPSTVLIQLSRLMEQLVDCARARNLHNPRKSSP